MNDNSTPDTLTDRMQSRWERRQERLQERRNLRYGGGEWILGMILIVIGGLVYLQTMKIYIFTNWWALFILIPAVSAFVEAWRANRAAEGKFTRRVRGSFIVGAGFTVVAAVFLLDLNWTIFGPVLLVLAGAALIFNGMFPN